MENTTIEMPDLKPVIIPTKGKPKWKKFLAQFKSRSWEVNTDYYFYVPSLDETLMIPKGFIFDGASVPRMLWPVLNPTGILFIGSIFHDFGYKYQCFLDKDRNILYNKESRAFFDKQFKDINVFVNEVTGMHTIAWAALRVFGFIAWNNHRKNNLSIDKAPKAWYNG